jgi:hypothetical protein
VRSQIEEHVLTVSRLDSWLRDHPPRFAWINNWPAASTPWAHPVVQTLAASHARASGATIAPPRRSIRSPGAASARRSAKQRASGLSSVVTLAAHCKDRRGLSEIVNATVMPSR